MKNLFFLFTLYLLWSCARSCDSFCDDCHDDGKCNICIDGYTPKISTFDNDTTLFSTCVPCGNSLGIQNCANCNTELVDCMQCNANYTPVLDSNSNSYCVSCSITNCSMCSTTEADTCATCKSGYAPGPDGSCVLCTELDSNCLTCNSTNGSSLTCAANYSVIDGQCINTADLQCDTNCKTCNGDKTCSLCDDTFLMSKSHYTCVECTDKVHSIANCADCNPASYGCKNCSEGYTPTPLVNICSKCGSILAVPNCGKCNSSSFTCNECKSGYTLIPLVKQCTRCNDNTTGIVGCQTCSNSSYNCLTCSPGYYMTTSLLGVQKCGACPKGCLNCTNSSVCLTCNSGFVLNSANGCTSSLQGNITASVVVNNFVPNVTVTCSLQSYIYFAYGLFNSPDDISLSTIMNQINSTNSTFVPTKDQINWIGYGLIADSS